MTNPSPIYSSNYTRRNRLTGNIRRLRRILRELEVIEKAIETIPETEDTDRTRKTMARYWLCQAHINATASHNQLVIQRDGIRALKKLQDKR